MCIREDWPIVAVNDDGIRPAGAADRCFYCDARVGDLHATDCVMVQKRVRLRYMFDVDVEMPHAWTPELIESHRNASSWCADNALVEIEQSVTDAEGCLCRRFRCEFVTTLDDTPKRELRPTAAELERTCLDPDLLLLDELVCFRVLEGHRAGCAAAGKAPCLMCRARQRIVELLADPSSCGGRR